MKNYINTCFYIFILGCSNENAIYELQGKGDVIVKILEDFNNKKFFKNIFLNESGVVYFNISESPEKKLSARITLLDENHFCFVDSLIGEPYGFFYYKKKTVIVFGNRAYLYFRKTSEKCSFDYLPIKRIANKVTNKDTNTIPTAPLNFEPMVYVYELKNNDYKFIYCDRNLFNYQIIHLDDSTLIESWKGDTIIIKTRFDSL
jgi:hypothetical protein